MTAWLPPGAARTGVPESQEEPLMEPSSQQDEPDPSGHGLFRPARADGADAVPAGTLADRLRRAIVADEPHAPLDAGMALAATVLWSRFLRFDVADPSWPDRDRFVLSSGRFVPLLRALLLLTGHGAVPPGCAFGRHPAIETASGQPGQGFAAAVGMAMAERALAGRFGRTLVDHRTWVLACETDLAAGVSLEAAFLAGRMGLDKLVVLSDAAAEPGHQAEAMTRFAASGWAVRRVDRDDPEALAAAMLRAMRNRRPTLLACQPGVARAAHRPGRRHAPHGNVQPGPEQDPATGAVWAACGQRGAGTRRGWLRRLARHRLHDEFGRTVAGHLPPNWPEGWSRGWAQGQTQGQGPATGGSLQREQDAHDAQLLFHNADLRDAGTLGTARAGLALLCGLLPEMMTLHSRAGAGLAAALLPHADGHPVPARTVRHLACGVQEHGMAALTNGLSLHGGARPVLAASVVSIDRMRPALRLAALMGQPVIYLLGDDGLQTGVDGAGWQPVEQLATLRAMPEVALFRPADHPEMVACWELALRRDDGPSLIAVSPVAFAPADAPGIRAAGAKAMGEGFCARGGYLRAPAEGPRAATLIATGPEVAVALDARALLREMGILVAVVSLPCWELFAAQPAAYRADILGEAPRVGIEAASGFGWERWLGADGVFIGMDGFGHTGPAGPSPRRTGITPEQVVARVRRRLGPVRPEPNRLGPDRLGPGRPDTGFV